MPSNYTIGKTLQRIAYYKGICGLPAESFTGASMAVGRLAGVKLEELHKSDWASVRKYLPEVDDEVVQAIEQMIKGETVTALNEDKIPLTILELTEVKGLGSKTARKVYDELGVVDLAGLKAAIDDGRIAKVKGFGPSMIEKVRAHVEAVAKKKK